MKNHNSIFTITLIVSLSACTTSTPYPDGWPTFNLNAENSCADLEGNYKNDNEKNFLSDLFNINIAGEKDNSSVEIEIKNTETLIVTLHREDRKPQRREITLRKNGYSCKNGVIHFKQDREYYVHQVVVATSRANVELFNSDKHIIAKIIHKSYSLAMLILPVKNNNQQWEKWSRVSHRPENTNLESE